VAKKGKTLQELRAEIDELDLRLLRLLSRRAEVARKIGLAKSERAKAVLDLAREKDVIRAVRGANPGPLGNDAVEAVFREIVSACRAAQEPTSVAFLGPLGTFSHAAALKQFGRTAVFVPVDTIADVFTTVEAGRARYGVVPVENTTEGAVTPTLDALADTPLKVIGEVLVRIDHFLVSRGGDRSKIRRIVSHPQPLAQCRNYLAKQFPGVPLVPAPSTAAAAAEAARDGAVAAIAGKLATDTHGLRIVAASIQDNPANVTRFLVVSDLPPDSPPRRTGDDRTSLVVSVHDEVGVLGRVLQPFTNNRINLSMIESRPILGRPWEYRFFLDVTGHVEDKPLARTLARVAKVATSTKVLGSYPVAR
jgi:chorismate mutase/prephenate dehydratase